MTDSVVRPRQELRVEAGSYSYTEYSNQPKARMLFVSPEFPFPASSGGRLRTLSLLRCLAARFDIHCVTFAESPPRSNELQTLRSLVKEATVLPLQLHRRTALQRYARNLRRVLGSVPPLVSRFSELPARHTLSALLKDSTDWVWLEHLWLAPYVPSICRRATKILDVHNVESEFYAQLRRASRNPIDRLGYYIFERAARRIERRFLGCFDRVLVVSEQDRQSLGRDCPLEKISIVPNAVALASVPTGADTSGCALYFAGRLDYLPNRDGVLWFYDQVWPLIRSRVPEVKWYLVGAFPELLIPRMGQDGNIVFPGQVEKTDPYLHPSSVTIVPLRLGGGTRFKILEAWAVAKSVVSTTKGAEGLHARNGENILLADTPEEFSNAVLRLLSNQHLRMSLGQNGRKTVQEHYSTERLCESLEANLFHQR